MSRVNFDRETSLPLLRTVAASLTGENLRLRREHAELSAQLAAARTAAAAWEQEREKLEAAQAG